MSHWRCLAFIAAFVCAPAYANLETLSFHQASDGGISVTLMSGPCPLGLVSGGTPQVSVSANEILISTEGVVLSYFGGGPWVCDPAIVPREVGVPLGKLADGIYHVVWRLAGLPIESKFSVVNGALRTIYPTSVNGFWYDPNASGTGFNVEAQYFGLFVTYYGWDASGHHLWLTSAFGPTSITPDSAITLAMNATTGGTFAQPHNHITPWGTLVLTFSSCKLATATLSGVDGSVNLSLQHLTFPINTPGC